MTKYVDVKWLLERAIPHGWSTPLWVSDILIKDAPPADVRENIHAHWEDCSNGWMCSACKRDSRKDTNFCPNCGAKMDGEWEDAE